MHKILKGILNHVRTWISRVVAPLVAILIAGCGGGESLQGHAPGEIERLSNATIYHLQDGVFIHEVFEGSDHYYLLEDDIVKSYELTQDGLKYAKENSAGDTPRPPVGKILGILRDSDSSSLITSLRGDEAAIKRIIDVFDESATVDSVRDMTRRPTAHHVAEFTHAHPNAGNAGSRPEKVEGKPFYGFDEENFSAITRMDGAETEVNFKFRLLDSRDGKDIYEIIRTVIERDGLDGPVTSESEGQPATVTVEYAGKELIVFDDEYGVAKFTPVRTKPTDI